MKRLLFMLIAIILFATILAGCSPDPQINSHNVRIARIIINAVDEYLDGTKSANAVSTIISREKANIDEDDDTTESGAFLFGVDVFLLDSQFSSLARGWTTDLERVLSTRNRVADMAGLDRRRNL